MTRPPSSPPTLRVIALVVGVIFAAGFMSPFWLAAATIVA